MGGMARDLALDFAKGLLVATMIVYHWMNFTWGPIGHVNDYFRFLTPAFIFLTGWTIGTFYPEKYGANNPQLFRRLTLRGLQLFGFFIGLNVIAQAVFKGRANPFRSQWSSVGQDVFGIFVSGNSELMSFHILLAISLLLLLAGQGLRLASPRRRVALWVISGAFLLSQLLPLPPSRNVYLLSFGLLGLLAGGTRQFWSAYLPRNSLLLPAGLVVYLMIVTLFGAQYMVQVFATPLHVALFYSLGQRLVGAARFATVIVWIGMNSLVGYLAHVAALQILVQFFRPRQTEPAIAATILIVASLGTALTIYLSNWLQQVLKSRARVVRS
jgi:hypothetical protein